MKWWLLILAIVIAGCTMVVGSAGAAQYSLQFEGMDAVGYWINSYTPGIPGEGTFEAELEPVLYTELRAKLPRLKLAKTEEDIIDGGIEIFVFLSSTKYDGKYTGYYGVVSIRVIRLVSLSIWADSFESVIYDMPMVITGSSYNDPVDHIASIIPSLVQKFAADLYEARPDL